MSILNYVIRCVTCQGHGRTPCEVCLGRGQLRCYIKLTVSWKTHRDEEMIERTTLPDELVKTAEGVVVVQEQQNRVYTIHIIIYHVSKSMM